MASKGRKTSRGPARSRVPTPRPRAATSTSQSAPSRRPLGVRSATLSLLHEHRGDSPGLHPQDQRDRTQRRSWWRNRPGARSLRAFRDSLQRSFAMTTEQKVAVITGASQGIGAALVKAYRDRGYRVVATARSVARSHDSGVLAVSGDIT